MPKVTVYVTREQMEWLRSARVSNLSREFQRFLDDLRRAEESHDAYGFVRDVMPVAGAVAALRSRLAAVVETGGPPAQGGPVAAALTVLAHQHLVATSPDLAQQFADECQRFGLADLVARELGDATLEDLLHASDDATDADFDRNDGESRPPAHDRFSQLVGRLELMIEDLSERVNTFDGSTRRAGARRHREEDR